MSATFLALWLATAPPATAEAPESGVAPAAGADRGEREPAPDAAGDRVESTAADPPLRVVVPNLEARGVDADLAANLTNVVLTRLGQLPGLEVVARQDLARVLDQEKQRQLVGCGEDAACLSDLAGALDASRLLTGTIGKVGERYLLSLALLDTSNAKLIRRVSRGALVADSLVTAATEATVALWATGVVELERCVDCADTGLSKRWEAAVKIGNNFSTFFERDLDVAALALGLDIDVGYRVWRPVAVFVSIGMRLNSVERTADGNDVGVQVLPLQLGLRYHTPKLVGDLAAYVAGAIGLGFLRTKVSDQDDELLTAFTARGYGGLVYSLGTRVGVLVELSYELTAKRSDDLQASRLDAAAVRLGLSYGF